MNKWDLPSYSRENAMPPPVPPSLSTKRMYNDEQDFSRRFGQPPKPIQSSPSYSNHYSNNTENNYVDNTDLSEELAAQIEYNNNLLNQLQHAEHKYQERVKLVSEKDHEIRVLRMELQQVKAENEQLRDVNYQMQVINEQQSHESAMLQNQLQESNIERKNMTQDQRGLMAKCDELTKLLNDRDSDIRNFNMHLMDEKKKYGKLEEAYKNLTSELDNLSATLMDEKNKCSEVKNQLKFVQSKSLEDQSAFQSQVKDLKELIHQHQLEKTQIGMERDRLEKTLVNLQSEIRQKEAHLDDAIRNLETENANIKRKLEMKQMESAEKSKNTIEILSQVQQEARTWCGLAEEFRERYISLANEVRTLQSISGSWFNFENTQSETLFSELKSSLDENSKLVFEGSKLEDTIQNLEVHLEEERAKSIMLEEKSSRLEQQTKEIQKRVESAEKRAEERYSSEMDRLRMEVNNVKGELIKMQDEAKSLQQKLLLAQSAKREADEREKSLQNQVRSLTESVKRIQKQLEQTKNLLKVVQDERSTLYDESESLRKELHTILSAPTPVFNNGLTSNIARPSSASKLTSLSRSAASSPPPPLQSNNFKITDSIRRLSTKLPSRPLTTEQLGSPSNSNSYQPPFLTSNTVNDTSPQSIKSKGSAYSPNNSSMLSLPSYDKSKISHYPNLQKLDSEIDSINIRTSRLKENINQLQSVRMQME